MAHALRAHVKQRAAARLQRVADVTERCPVPEDDLPVGAGAADQRSLPTPVAHDPGLSTFGSFGCGSSGVILICIHSREGLEQTRPSSWALLSAR